MTHITNEILIEMYEKGQLSDNGMRELLNRLLHPEIQQEIEECKEVVKDGKEPRYVKCANCMELFLQFDTDEKLCEKCDIKKEQKEKREAKKGLKVTGVPVDNYVERLLKKGEDSTKS